jgi:RNA polymerase sigma-70 factor (ECF subfamily)
MSAATPRLECMPFEGRRPVPPSFEETYDKYFEFVWLSLRRLGVGSDLLDDATQDVFVVVYRKLGEFAFRSQLKTWLFAIAVRVARAYRRRERPRALSSHPEELVSPHASPLESAAEAEALRLMTQILASLCEDRRVVFIMAELDQVPLPEVAEALGLKLNTAYSRLRLAREEFAAHVERHRARERRRS